MSRNWVVTLNYAMNPDTDAMDSWEDELRELDAMIARVPGPGIAVTIHADNTSLDKALTRARGRTGAVMPGEPVGVEIVAEDEHLRRADDMAVPELMSAAEIAEELGISRQRVHQLRSGDTFPAPVAELRSGAVWSASAIRRFAREWSRKPGRPARARLRRSVR